ncbi:MAG TPA: hypothetical protein VGQ36_10860 [Thermoanaerobaculia bacterium]|jgi:hypothetical protein|nr:hypothetical protein [Thermoanaerobaculia bacterium]
MNALALVFLLFATPAIEIDTTKLADTGGVGESAEIVQPPQRKAPMVAGPSFYVCPKDAAMLRVLNAPRNATFHCPVDGTVMKESVGRGKQYWLLD